MSNDLAPGRRPFALAPRARRAGRIAAQTALLALFWFGIDWAVRTLGVPVPSGVIGLAALLALLFSGRVAPGWVEDGAKWLLSDMLLFFIPATVAVVQYGGLFRANGWRLALVVVAGTAVVWAWVAIAVDAAARFERRFALARVRAARTARVERFATRSPRADECTAAAQLQALVRNTTA